MGGAVVVRSISMRKELRRIVETTKLGIYIELLNAVMSLGAAFLYVAETYAVQGDVASRSSAASDELLALLSQIELAMSVYFVGDFIFRLYISNPAWKYVVSMAGLIDILTIVPVFLQASSIDIGQLSFISLARVLRILRIVRVHRTFAYVESEVSRSLLKLVLSVLSLVFVAAGLFHAVENIFVYKNNGELDFFAAVYFIGVSVTTVGYGDISPGSSWGRAIVLILIAAAFVMLPMETNNFLRVLQSASQFASARYYPPRDPTRRAATVQVLVCGDVQSSGVGTFFRELLHEDHGGVRVHVVVLSPHSPSPYLRAILDDVIMGPHITFLQGSPLLSRDMARAHAHTCDGAFVLVNKFSRRPQTEDAAAMLTALAVKKYVWMHGLHDAHLYLQLIRPESKRHFMATLPSTMSLTVVCTSQMTMNLLAMSTAVPAVTTLLFNLLSSDETRQLRGSAPRWLKEYLNGASYEVYRTSLSKAFADVPFNEAAALVYEETGVLMFGLELTDRQAMKKKRPRGVPLPPSAISRILLNPGCMRIPNYRGLGVRGFVIAKDKPTADLVGLGHSHEKAKLLTKQAKDSLARLGRALERKKPSVASSTRSSSPTRAALPAVTIITAAQAQAPDAPPPPPPPSSSPLQQQPPPPPPPAATTSSRRDVPAAPRKPGSDHHRPASGSLWEDVTAPPDAKAVRPFRGNRPQASKTSFQLPTSSFTVTSSSGNERRRPAEVSSPAHRTAAAPARSILRRTPDTSEQQQSQQQSQPLDAPARTSQQSKPARRASAPGAAHATAPAPLAALLNAAAGMGRARRGSQGSVTRMQAPDAAMHDLESIARVVAMHKRRRRSMAAALASLPHHTRPLTLSSRRRLEAVVKRTERRSSRRRRPSLTSSSGLDADGTSSPDVSDSDSSSSQTASSSSSSSSPSSLSSSSSESAASFVPSSLGHAKAVRRSMSPSDPTFPDRQRGDGGIEDEDGEQAKQRTRHSTSRKRHSSRSRRKRRARNKSGRKTRNNKKRKKKHKSSRKNKRKHNRSKKRSEKEQTLPDGRKQQSGGERHEPADQRGLHPSESHESNLRRQLYARGHSGREDREDPLQGGAIGMQMGHESRSKSSPRLQGSGSGGGGTWERYTDDATPSAAFGSSGRLAGVRSPSRVDAAHADSSDSDSGASSSIGDGAHRHHHHRHHRHRHAHQSRHHHRHGRYHRHHSSSRNSSPPVGASREDSGKGSFHSAAQSIGRGSQRDQTAGAEEAAGDHGAGILTTTERRHSSSRLAPDEPPAQHHAASSKTTATAKFHRAKAIWSTTRRVMNHMAMRRKYRLRTMPALLSEATLHGDTDASDLRGHIVLSGAMVDLVQFIAPLRLRRTVTLRGKGGHAVAEPSSMLAKQAGDGADAGGYGSATERDASDGEEASRVRGFRLRKGLGPLAELEAAERRPILLLHPVPPTPDEWETVAHYADVWFLRGSPLNDGDLRKARLHRAAFAVVLSAHGASPLAFGQAMGSGMPAAAAGLQTRRTMIGGDGSTGSDAGAAMDAAGGVDPSALVDAEALFFAQAVWRAAEAGRLRQRGALRRRNKQLREQVRNASTPEARASARRASVTAKLGKCLPGTSWIGGGTLLGCRVICELVDGANVSYLRPETSHFRARWYAEAAIASKLGSGIGGLDSSVSLEDDASGSALMKAHPHFASGSVMTAGMLDALLVQAFYNPAAIMLLEQLLLGSRSAAINSSSTPSNDPDTKVTEAGRVRKPPAPSKGSSSNTHHDDRAARSDTPSGDGRPALLKSRRVIDGATGHGLSDNSFGGSEALSMSESPFSYYAGFQQQQQQDESPAVVLTSSKKSQLQFQLVQDRSDSQGSDAQDGQHDLTDTTDGQIVRLATPSRPHTNIVPFGGLTGMSAGSHEDTTRRIGVTASSDGRQELSDPAVSGPSTLEFEEEMASDNPEKDFGITDLGVGQRQAAVAQNPLERATERVNHLHDQSFFGNPRRGGDPSSGNESGTSDDATPGSRHGSERHRVNGRASRGGPRSSGGAGHVWGSSKRPGSGGSRGRLAASTAPALPRGPPHRSFSSAGGDDGSVGVGSSGLDDAVKPHSTTEHSLETDVFAPPFPEDPPPAAQSTGRRKSVLETLPRWLGGQGTPTPTSQQQQQQQHRMLSRTANPSIRTTPGGISKLDSQRHAVGGNFLGMAAGEGSGTDRTTVDGAAALGPATPFHSRSSAGHFFLPSEDTPTQRSQDDSKGVPPSQPATAARGAVPSPGGAFRAAPAQRRTAGGDAVPTEQRRLAGSGGLGAVPASAEQHQQRQGALAESSLRSTRLHPTENGLSMRSGRLRGERHQAPPLRCAAAAMESDWEYDSDGEQARKEDQTRLGRILAGRLPSGVSGARVIMLPVPAWLAGSRYAKVVNCLMLDYQIVPLGLYRGVHPSRGIGRNRNAEPYVATNPASTGMVDEWDSVYCVTSDAAASRLLRHHVGFVDGTWRPSDRTSPAPALGVIGRKA